jgi:glutathione S-transferase
VSYPGMNMKITTTLLFGALTSGFSLVSTTTSFVLGRPSAQPLLASSFSSSKVSRGGATRLDLTTTTTSTATTSSPPTWQELQEQINPDISTNANADTSLSSSLSLEQQPVLTLYRDTNGWCPFCERVWLCICAKQLPYRERLVNLQNKPDWYKELVPTTQVPAMLLHPPATSSTTKSNSRTIIWESLDIMKALDDAFPNTPRLVLDTPDYHAASEQTSQLNTVGFRYVFSSRNTSLTALEVEELKQDFIKGLDLLEDSLQQASTAASSNGGPLFRLGSEFSGVDAELIPTLERWRYQLPLTKEFDILQGRPFLQKWFATMDSFQPYAERVAGDAYTWAATAAMFTRYFGGDSDNQENIQAIARSDAAAAKLAQAFSDSSSLELESVDSSRLARLAAEKLIANHEAVIADCTNQDPKSQQHLGRSSDVTAADIVLRHVCSLLLLEDGTQILEAAQTGPMVDMMSSDHSNQEQRLAASQAARTVATRLSVPRDMGAPSAKILRAVLSIVADRLDEETKTPQV